MRITLLLSGWLLIGLSLIACIGVLPVYEGWNLFITIASLLQTALIGVICIALSTLLQRSDRIEHRQRLILDAAGVEEREPVKQENPLWSTT